MLFWVILRSNPQLLPIYSTIVSVKRGVIYCPFYELYREVSVFGSLFVQRLTEIVRDLLVYVSVRFTASARRWKVSVNGGSTVLIIIIYSYKKYYLN